MINPGDRWFRFGAMATFLMTSLLTSSCQPMYTASFGPSNVNTFAGTRVSTAPTLEDMASELDDLERQIERTGSVVAEQPSVWGQARLTMYREEFETQMQGQLSKFQPTLQGSLSRSDQAYAADAMALSYTAQAAAATPTSPLPLTCALNGASSSSSSSSASSAADGSTASTSPSTPSGTATSPLDPLAGAFDAFGNIKRNPARLANPLGFAVTGQGAISLEPTVYLDQMKRYIDHLHELRRMSDGDDTADAPGYSLNLVRIPVSILPGRQTQQRYGAEITFRLRPHLHAELLPMTFRNLVVNDLLDQLAVPLTQMLNDVNVRDALSQSNGNIGPAQTVVAGPAELQKFRAAVQQSISNGKPDDPSYSKVIEAIVNARQVGSATRLRTAQRPFPSSQIDDIYGITEWADIIVAAYQVIKSDIPNKGVVHYPDVQSYIQQELNGSYSFLRDAAQNFANGQTRIGLWRFCSPQLVSAIRGRRITEIEAMRKEFEDDVKALGAKQSTPTTTKPLDLEVTPTLAWAILVDSALLNQQLMQDMGEAAAARGGSFPLLNVQSGEWRPYYLPQPDTREKESFNEYVSCRWPIHVFSLDPEVDQQNIADTYSSRREMQLAMSLAFVSGKLSADNMFRYARRLETDMETIALNNTMVGFSHGADTFGWRFYPRFQSPDTDNNLTVFFRDLLWGGPNRKTLLRERQLEPGIRECVAIVLMPSFCPYADLEASSNWFALDNPHRKVMNSVRAVRLGEQLKSIQNCMQMVGNPQCYRDGDIERLRGRADQLESRLPLQSMSVQVPYENTLGGFAMFSTGVTDLAPELLGWYGAPAVNLDAPTTMFLIGNHFSVHQTRVIIGGQEIAASEMLSRQVMKVTIPANAIAVVENSGEVYGGWKEPTYPARIRSPKSLSSGTTTSGAATTVKAPPSAFAYPNDWYMFSEATKNAITLADPAIPGSLDALKLTVNHGALTLGASEGISFTSGANGSASLAVAGTADKLNCALNGLAYTPKPGFSGNDVLRISFAGSGVSSACESSVAITVRPIWPDFLYVDVQLATPYGTTSHLLVPAWHLGKTGSGALAPAAAGGSSGASAPGPDASVASQGSTPVSQPQWTSAQWSLGYVNKGIGITASDPPSYTPNALTLNLGTYYLVPSDSAVTLKLKLGGNASGSPQPLKIAIIPGTPGPGSSANYDPKTHVLTIAGTDLDNLTKALFNVIQYQFGTSRPVVPPNTSFTLSTTVSGTGQADITLINQLTVNLVSAAAKAATPSTPSPSAATTP